MNQLQTRLLNLIKVFDELCRKHDITYYLAAGTLLGAIRHGGFIPWDDDADVIMTRSNWEKFMENAGKDLPSDLHIHSQYNNIHSGAIANGITENNSTNIYRLHISNPEETGIQLDVIIMDPVPGDQDSVNEYLGALAKYHALTNLYYQFSLRTGHSLNFAHLWERAEKESLWTVTEEITKKAFNHNEDDATYYIQRDARASHIWKKELYGAPRYVVFEDAQLPVPSHAEEILAIEYGDEWAKMPKPGSLETIAHDHVVRDFDVPCKQMLSDFEVQIDRNKLLDLFVRRKEAWDNEADRKLYVENSLNRLAFAKTEMKYEALLKEVDLDKLILEEDYDKLSEILEEYISLQCNDLVLGTSSLARWEYTYHKENPMLIDIGDKGIKATILLLLHFDNRRHIRGLIKARRKIDRAIPEDLEEVFSLFEDICEAEKTKYSIDKERVKRIAEEWQDKVAEGTENHDEALIADFDAASPALIRRLEILDDLDDICRRNSIKYFLTGKALLQAYRYGKAVDPNTEITVTMLSEDSEKFIEAVNKEQPKNRYIDSMLTNQYYHRMGLRFCDTESTDYNVTVRGERFGIFINIDIARHPLMDQDVDSELDMLETGWEATNVTRKYSQKIKDAEALIEERIAIDGREETARKLFNDLLGKDKELDREKLFVKEYFEERLFFPIDYFQYENEIEFMGRKYRTMAFIERYLGKVYGKNWREKPIGKTVISPYRRVIDTSVRSDDVIAYIDNSNIDRDKIWNTWRESNRAYSHINSMSKEIDKYWELMQAVGERYRLAKEYNPKIEQLEELFNNYKFDELETELEDYIKSVKQYARKNISLGFNKKLEELADFCLRRRNEADFAKDNRERLKKAKWPEIDDYKVEERK